MTPQLAGLLLYSAGLVALGLWIGRRVHGTSDFFVAGRQLGPGLLFSTMLAANIGAGSTIGAASLGYRDGLSAWWWVGSAGIGSIVLAFWVGPAIRRIAQAHDLRTVGDFLEWRFGADVRAIVTILLWFGTLAILAGQLIAVAWILNVVVGIPKWSGCLIGAVVMTAYFTAGGLLTSAWVNLVELVVLLAGFAVAFPIALHAAGGWPALTAAATAPPMFWHFTQGGGSGVVYLAMLGPAFIVSPGLLQKIYGARDDRAVRIGVGANAAVLLVFAFVPTLLGMMAQRLHPGLPANDLALPMLLMHDMPAGVGSLALAALFSAEVSTADAILFMLSTSLSQDLYRRFIRPDATDATVLRVARWAAVAGGAGGVLLALAAESVIGALTIFYTLLSVSLFVPILAGLYWRRAARVDALAALGIGVGCLLAVQAATAGQGFGGLWTPALIGLIASCAGFLVAQAARRPGAGEGTGARPLGGSGYHS
ncbi:MAG TPA: sodium:solute symporter family protein [Vicinamibacterales bacterium]